MEKGIIAVYCGMGKGKSAVAIGQAIQAVGQGKSVIVIQFLKGKDTAELGFLDRLEPEIKLFRFEKFERYYEDLSEEEKQEEIQNIKNGLNFARKVLATEGCDLLILDEILGVVNQNIITVEELKTILDARHKEMDILMTGYSVPEDLKDAVDVITTLETSTLHETES